MHSAGIEAMGVLMDRIYARLSGSDEDIKVVQRELEKVAPACRWTKGTWETLGHGLERNPEHAARHQEAAGRAGAAYAASSSTMKFLYSDTQDYVDPDYDFLNDRLGAEPRALLDRRLRTRIDEHGARTMACSSR